MSRRRVTAPWGALVAALWVFQGPALGAEDLGEGELFDEAALFAEGAFEAEVEAGRASGEANQVTWLTGVSLASSTNLVVTEAQDTASRSTFSGKAFWKASSPTLGAFYASTTFDHTLWATASDPNGSLAQGYERAEPDPSEPKWKLSEAHLSFDLGKVVFVRLGNQLLDWGASAVWSPADFVNRRPADPDSPLDVRSGKPGLRLHLPWATGNLFVFADASRSVTDDGQVLDLAETGVLAAKVDTTLAGWNLGLVAQGGADTDPRLGVTAVGALAGFDLWAEWGSVLPLQDRDFAWSASLGGERSWGTDGEWTLRSEAYYNPEGQGDIDLTPQVLAGYTPYYWGQVYVYAELLKKKFLTSAVTGSLSATANLSDGSWVSTASLRTAFPNTLPLNLFVQMAGGADQREFTLATGGPAVTLGLRSVVEF